MSRCDACGTKYEQKAFEVVMGGIAYCYHSFDCAVHDLAAICAGCGCKVIGGGLLAEGAFYCSENCAEEALSVACAAAR